MVPARRLAAYEIAMRITPAPADVTEVLQRCETIRRFIAADDMSDLRIQVLEALTTALGVGPGRPPAPGQQVRLPHADQLVERARRVLNYVNP
ncbi:hypothetical protein [Nonomuraea gerenzanensis]|uniref:Uncharacterized protein n=1 Tax=Nonomuraea gerenzanensis TaxID=93944 RepID=A0A1M4BKY1_9ACTN|nr:hypothetical protein [Nonomuraea gerenzanensis]UBU10050.1 hypothetical protein LCN96_37615 [Nonomuraea gerenzanensis]SAP16325.1 hypothetical protein BN4615_P10988 [Nonomuraea gerenzanensis]